MVTGMISAKDYVALWRGLPPSLWRDLAVDNLDDLCGLRYPTGAVGIDRRPNPWWNPTPALWFWDI
jgi:hypothetical protein